MNQFMASFRKGTKRNTFFRNIFFLCLFPFLSCQSSFSGKDNAEKEALFPFSTLEGLDKDADQTYLNLVDREEAEKNGDLKPDELMTDSKILQVFSRADQGETKIKIKLSGAFLKEWLETVDDTVFLTFYPPAQEKTETLRFFLGIAEDAAVWRWVGGVMGRPEGPLQKGKWNLVRYTLPVVFKKLDPKKIYSIYLSFFHKEKSGDTEITLPVQEPFYLGSLLNTEQAEDYKKTPEELLENFPRSERRAVAALAKKDNNALLDEIAKRAFYFLWDHTNPENGLVLDRLDNPNLASIASVGFALSALIPGVERGWISREEGEERARTTLEFLTSDQIPKWHGFFYHFMDMKTGERAPDSEISSVDTALLMAGVLSAGEYFGGAIRDLSRKLYREVEWPAMIKKDFISMGWKPETGLLPSEWDSYNEGILTYLLAAGSPDHPVSEKAWEKLYRPLKENYISLPQEPLFVYQYPHIWFDFRKKEDHYANYFQNSVTASRWNRLFTFLRRGSYESYTKDIWGLSASDGPDGYKAYGAAPYNHDGTIAPYASIASLVFTPRESLRSVRAMLTRYGPLVWKSYGFISAFNEDRGYYPDDVLGIDSGDILLMIENYRSGLIWKYFMQSPYARASLEKLGFKESDGSYAVTPGYRAEYAKALLAPSEKVLTAVPVKAMKIDNDYADWDSVPEAGIVEENMSLKMGGIKPVDPEEQTLKGAFKFAYDSTNLYFYVKVQDSTPVVNLSPKGALAGNFYRTDSLEIELAPTDANPEKIIKLALLPFDKKGRSHIVRHEDADPGSVAGLSGLLYKLKKISADSYEAEMALPLRYLSSGDGSPDSLRFNLILHNANDPKAPTDTYVRENILSWVNIPEIWNKPKLWSQVNLKK